MSPAAFTLAVALIAACVVLVAAVVVWHELREPRRQRDGCGLCRRWEPVDCSCPRRCTALVCRRKEGTR